MMTSKVEIILQNTPFPGAGQQIGGHHVIESMVDVQGKNWAVYLRGKLSQAQVKSALASMTNTHFALPVQDEFSLISFKPKGMTHARTNPPGDVTVVRGHMYYARPNPISKTDFHQEMDEMLIDNPEKHFTKYTVKNIDQLHQRLWKGVSYAGESYGWKKGDELWHRRASFIMPKIKINKALKGATMFYHTHPSKDEPSLTSADDIQFYLDLHFAWGIKSFYTVMKHKLDHFTITSKPGGAEKYLRMEEDAFIDTVDGMIGKGEEVAKKEVGEDRPEVEFQNRITKEMVDLFNKKFKSIAKISFRPKAKNPASKLARKSSNNPIAALVNPAPNPPIKVKDQYVAKALDELKGLDYAHEHYGADEYGHTMYVYWWLKHHLAPTPKQPKGRLYKLNEYGLDSDTRKKLRNYLSQSIIGNYNYMDAVYLLALYHDIAKLREKGVKEPGWEIGAEMFRKEIGPELNLPEKLTEDLAFLFDTDLGRKGITDEEFLTQSGDYYGASKLVQMADMITHHPTMYTKKGGEAYKQEAMVSMINQLRTFLDHHYVIQNPPPQVNTLQWVASYDIELAYEEAEELLGEFHQSVIPDNDGKTKQSDDESSGGHLYYMRFNNTVIPGLTRTFKANLALSTGKLTVYVGSPTPDDLGKKAANDIYQLVGSRLKESYPEIEIEEIEPETIVNPRHANKIQIISISGPSGGGKSTVLRHLHKHIPNSSIPPTYTTRPRRRSDGADRKFVSQSQFKAMLKRGEFVEYTISGNGHYYGRRFKDFLGNVAIIEVSLQGKKHYEKRFANVFSVYLDPDPTITEEERAKAIFRRGGLTKEEAKRRAKKATETVKRSKKMQFDLRVTMMKGKYEEGAKKVLSEVPLVNSSHKLDIGISEEEQKKFDDALAAEKERIRKEEAEEAARQKEWRESLVPIPLDVGITLEEQEAAARLRAQEKELLAEEERRAAEAVQHGRLDVGITPEEQARYDELLAAEKERIRQEEEEEKNNPKDLFDWFEDWAKLINMKNKELQAFLDSDWGKVAGLSPEEAKKLGINSGRTSGRRILKMRKKLGLGGPKDYIKGPRHLEEMWEVALKKWTGPASKKGTDWYWCTRQVRFNKRFMGDNFGERKGPLVKKQKTQNQPSRRLLSLWVWGHDPWRYARKNGIERMPKCPDVPWVGRTEKIKYGKIEVIPGPRKNPPVTSTWGDSKSVVLDENLQYKPYTGNTKLPFRLSYQLTKNLRSLLARDREYAGFVKDNKMHYGTSFGVRGVRVRYSPYLSGAEFVFHTHPIGFRKGVIGTVSPQDLMMSCSSRMFYGVEWHLVVQNRGINMIRTSLREDSDLYKTMIAGNKEKWKSKKINNKFDKLYDAEMEVIENLYNPKKKYRKHLVEKELGIPHPNWNSYTELQEEGAMINTANKFMKAFTFDMWYLEVPSIHWDWTKEMTESYPLDDSKFSDVANWIKRPRQIRVNPHYTPPPNVAMFPGEMPQGPAALYQQTISISQLNPPRSKPFPWNKERVKRSPLKTMKRAKATYKAWKEGKPIGFSATTSLKSMGKIPRASGKYELGDKYVRINPVRAPTPYTMMERHEIGTLEGPHGHVIEGGKLEDLGLQEIITVDTVREPDTNKFLLGLYEDWKKSAKELGKGADPIREGGAFKALKALVNNTRYRPQDEMFDEALSAKEEMIGQTWTLDKIDEYGGICRHQALVNAWILERALKEGRLSGKVFYETGAGHAWTVYRQSDGKEVIIDSAQNTWKYRDDANKVGYQGSDGRHYIYEQAVERPDGKIEVHLVRSNPRTKKGRKFPSKYLKGLTPTEKAIARYEIDRGYEYSMDDPAAYKDWRSDIKAKARGLKTVPSKWRNKFAKKYGPLKKGYDFLDRMAKTTGIKRKYLKKIQDKGLAAWRVGHRPGVTPMQWARGRVYAFVMAAPSSTGPGKPDHKLAVEAGVR